MSQEKPFCIAFPIGDVPAFGSGFNTTVPSVLVPGVPLDIITAGLTRNTVVNTLNDTITTLKAGIYEVDAKADLILPPGSSASLSVFRGTPPTGIPVGVPSDVANTSLATIEITVPLFNLFNLNAGDTLYVAPTAVTGVVTYENFIFRITEVY